MLVRGVEDIQVVQEQAALLRIAMLVARDEPLDSLFGAVAAEVSQLLGVEAGAVPRFMGGERAGVVGGHPTRGGRGLPGNAGVGGPPPHRAVGRAPTTPPPPRLRLRGRSQE